MSAPSLRVGIACFPTLGGSGVVASELALQLSARGHRVHVFSSGAPGRLGRAGDGVILHRVDPFSRPPLEHGAYELSLAAAIAGVATREGLDVLHAHYAVPHASSALLARDILRREGRPAPRVITTLHGTDAGLVGAAPGMVAVTRHAALESDLLTAPSAWLSRAAVQALALPADHPVEVVPNFVDPAQFTPEAHRPGLLPLFPSLRDDGPDRPRVLVHASNFRALKRVGDVVLAFAEVARALPALLLLVGDGPDLEDVQHLVRALGLEERVSLVGAQARLERLLLAADLFLLPSDTESFGLAALEALSCGVPVIASDVGGLPEVVRRGETGLLVPPRDPHALAEAALSLLADEPRRAAMGRAARADVLARFQPGPVVDRWEALYRGG